MMFVVRSAGDAPDIPAVELKASRQTPADVPGGAGKTDYFCIGDAEAIAALRDAGWEVVELRDGWYAGDRGGGVAISGQGRYSEIRDTLFTVKDAAGPAETAASSKAEAEHVNVRGAIFGV
jgi:hypothetical protein